MYLSNLFQERKKQVLANKQESQAKSNPQVLIDKWMGEIQYWRLQGACTADPIEKSTIRGFISAMNDCITDTKNFIKQEEELNQKK